ncbi:hypothetical protein AB0M11_22450 [Streptomyces sp. NPDC051987]|uniref:hypothetical protein n=1 Tax=Streptomyces sp. NPDC051987 TaxID=3155808 RepID=UPI00343974C6
MPLLLAGGVARDAARRPEPPAALPTVLITGHASVTVSGRPHFGRSIQLAAERAERVRALFVQRLEAHLRELGSPLTSDAFTIATDAHAPDLSPATQEAPPGATVAITRPPGL